VVGAPIADKLVVPPAAALSHPIARTSIETPPYRTMDNMVAADLIFSRDRSAAMPGEIGRSRKPSTSLPRWFAPKPSAREIRLRHHGSIPQARSQSACRSALSRRCSTAWWTWSSRMRARSMACPLARESIRRSMPLERSRSSLPRSDRRQRAPHRHGSGQLPRHGHERGAEAGATASGG